MFLSSTQIYYLRRWLQQVSVMQRDLTEQILDITKGDELEQGITNLTAQEQQQLDYLLKLHPQLFSDKYAGVSQTNVEQQILSLLKISSHALTPDIYPTQANLDLWLDTFNNVSSLAQRYLGRVIVRNYWFGTKPDEDVLQHFSVSDTGLIHYRENTTRRVELGTEAQNHLRQWLRDFIQRCQNVFPTFTNVLVSQQLVSTDQSLFEA